MLSTQPSGSSPDAIEGEGSFVTETTVLTTDVDKTSSAAPAAKSSGLAGLKLAQLQALASQLGISGSSRMRKGDLVTAISDHQRGSSVADRPAKGEEAAKAPAATKASATKANSAKTASPAICTTSWGLLCSA